jgi:hypothetical protein
MKRPKTKPTPKSHFVFRCSEDHRGFWKAYFTSSVGHPEDGAVDRLLEDRPDLNREAVVSIGYDVQSGMGEGVPWRSRHGIAAGDVRLVVEAYQRQHLAHIIAAH